MTYLLTALLALAILMLVAGRILDFSARDPEAYAGTEPGFDLRRHLSGPILCEGMIHGPSGRVTSRFSARMEGRWDGNQGILSEAFVYSTGTTQNREWRITMIDESHFTAEADDVVGLARGEVSGATVRMQYRLRLPEEAGGHVLSVTDWMFLGDNGVIMNRSVMRKFGIKVAELVATMRPDEARLNLQQAAE